MPALEAAQRVYHNGEERLDYAGHPRGELNERSGPKLSNDASRRGAIQPSRKISQLIPYWDTG